jgi:hypothetical protein
MTVFFRHEKLFVTSALWEVLDKGQMDNCRCFLQEYLEEARAAIKEVENTIQN